jgi:hypothetical protein
MSNVHVNVHVHACEAKLYGRWSSLHLFNAAVSLASFLDPIPNFSIEKIREPEDEAKVSQPKKANFFRRWELSFNAAGRERAWGRDYR